MKTAEVKIEPNLHAHRCEACFRKGVTTIWVHDNSHGSFPGQTEEMAKSCVKIAASHTCPKCGANEWEKWLIPVGKLPDQKEQQPFVRFVSLEQVERILTSAVVFIAVLLFSYAVFMYIGNRKNGAA